MSTKQEMNPQEIIEFGLRHTYGKLVNDGFDVLSVMPELNMDPLILAKKDE